MTAEQIKVLEELFEQNKIVLVGMGVSSNVLKIARDEIIKSLSFESKIKATLAQMESEVSWVDEQPSAKTWSEICAKLKEVGL